MVNKSPEEIAREHLRIINESGIQTIQEAYFRGYLAAINSVTNFVDEAQEEIFQGEIPPIPIMPSRPIAGRISDAPPDYWDIAGNTDATGRVSSGWERSYVERFSEREGIISNAPITFQSNQGGYAQIGNSEEASTASRKNKKAGQTKNATESAKPKEGQKREETGIRKFVSSITSIFRRKRIREIVDSEFYESETNEEMENNTAECLDRATHPINGREEKPDNSVLENMKNMAKEKNAVQQHETSASTEDDSQPSRRYRLTMNCDLSTVRLPESFARPYYLTTTQPREELVGLAEQPAGTLMISGHENVLNLTDEEKQYWLQDHKKDQENFKQLNVPCFAERLDVLTLENTPTLPTLDNDPPLFIKNPRTSSRDPQ